MTIRAYTPDDFPIVEQWAKARSMAIVPQLLSPTGFIVEDESGPLMAAFAYLMFDCPLVQVDHLLGRPGADIASIRQAWQTIQGAVIAWVKQVNALGGYNYRILRGFTSPEIAREAAKNGWLIDDSSLKCVRYAF